MDHWRVTPLADSLRIIEIREPSQAAATLATREVHLAQIPRSLILETKILTIEYEDVLYEENHL